MVSLFVMNLNRNITKSASKIRPVCAASTINRLIAIVSAQLKNGWFCTDSNQKVNKLIILQLQNCGSYIWLSLKIVQKSLQYKHYS